MQLKVITSKAIPYSKTNISMTIKGIKLPKNTK